MPAFLFASSDEQKLKESFQGELKSLKFDKERVSFDTGRLFILLIDDDSLNTFGLPFFIFYFHL